MSSDLNDNAKTVNNEKKCVLCGPMESIDSGDYILSSRCRKNCFICHYCVPMQSNFRIYYDGDEWDNEQCPGCEHNLYRDNRNDQVNKDIDTLMKKLRISKANQIIFKELIKKLYIEEN
jgi:hypothetical protein